MIQPESSDHIAGDPAVFNGPNYLLMRNNGISHTDEAVPVSESSRNMQAKALHDALSEQERHTLLHRAAKQKI